jgi:hypothetical protein
MARPAKTPWSRPIDRRPRTATRFVKTKRDRDARAARHALEDVRDNSTLKEIWDDKLFGNAE